MRVLRVGATATLLALWAHAAHAASACRSPDCRGFLWQPLGRNVYAAIRREPAGLLEHANSLVIISDQDVVVVDAQMTPTATRELIGAIRELTPKPVRYVINTHWHDDHVFGNAAYKAAYPGVEFVGTANTRDDLATLGRDNRTAFIANLPAEIKMLRRALESGNALNWRDLRAAGPPLDAATRASYRSDVAQAEAYLRDVAGTEVILPNVLVDSELTLARGECEIRILNLGQTHTRGDLVVWLPKERILATGDAVSAIVPMASGTTDLEHWSAALGRLRALEPETLVPGHGAVQHGGELISRTQGLIDALRERTRAAYAPGIDVDGLRKQLSFDDLRAVWAGDDPVRQFLFALFFEQPALASAHRRLEKGG